MRTCTFACVHACDWVCATCACSVCVRACVCVYACVCMPCVCDVCVVSVCAVCVVCVCVWGKAGIYMCV